MKRLPIVTGCIITTIMDSQLLPLPANAAEKNKWVTKA